MKKIISAVLVLGLTVGITASMSACKKKAPSNERKGNLYDVTIGAGDVYADITVAGFDDDPNKTGTMSYKLFPEIAPNAVKAFTNLATQDYYDERNLHRVVPNGLIQGGSMNGNGNDEGYSGIPDNMLFDTEPSSYARNFYGALSMASFAYTPKVSAPEKDGDDDDSNTTAAEAPKTVNKNYVQFSVVARKTSVDTDAIAAQYEAELSSEKAAALKPDAKKAYQDIVNSLKSMPVAAKEKYKLDGGMWELDGKNSVFGQMVSGWDILDKIAAVQVGYGNTIDDAQGIASRPVREVIIKDVKITIIPDPKKTTQPETTKKTKATTLPDLTGTGTGGTIPTTVTGTTAKGIFDKTNSSTKAPSTTSENSTAAPSNTEVSTQPPNSTVNSTGKKDPSMTDEAPLPTAAPPESVG
ncbi:MAG: peptidylprolyl isomerase [Oscillospiraceae bacterium]|jgi:cyclophilin family peptidyl-prolyl cis-trans isomerase|nr:peptidylprolyl isomerase [Oscillospiraceae bacterium]